MKRIFDILASSIGLIFLSPFILIPMVLIYFQDYKNPLYLSKRMGKNRKYFNMIKLRSMIHNADLQGIDSTSLDDHRITNLGKFIRKYKLDELTQLINVLKGDMSFVGPRPNVKSGVDLYTDAEELLLSVRPGITDFSSIVFSDEGEIINNHRDPDEAYNLLIRPWKSRLGIIYINNHSFILDLKIIFYTFILIFNRRQAINWVVNRLQIIGCSSKIIKVCHRVDVLSPYPPPGFKEIVTKR